MPVQRSQIHLRVSTDTRERWEVAAKLEGKALNEFIADAANDAARLQEIFEQERQEIEDQKRRVAEYLEKETNWYREAALRSSPRG
jgi:uncharacterized protein (DUF1778 family)